MSTRMIHKYFSLLIALVLFFSSCDILKQVEEMKALSKCEFRINTLTDIHLAGVNVSNIQHVSDLKPLDIMLLTNAIINNQLPLHFNLNLQVKNPNDQTASLNRIEWILFIDDLQMLEGVVNERFTIGAGDIATLPVPVAFNLAEMLQGEQGNIIIDFALGMNEGNNTTNRVMVKLKPSLMIGQHSLLYPGWIEVRNAFTAQ